MIVIPKLKIKINSRAELSLFLMYHFCISLSEMYWRVMSSAYILRYSPRNSMHFTHHCVCTKVSDIQTKSAVDIARVFHKPKARRALKRQVQKQLFSERTAKSLRKKIYRAEN